MASDGTTSLLISNWTDALTVGWLPTQGTSPGARTAPSLLVQVEGAFAIIACNAVRPSVSAAGPGCRINGDLISCSAPCFTAGMRSKPGLLASFSGRNFL